jgi:hypothetical protein
MKANPKCTSCHGTGTVYDSVPYGSYNIGMPSQCDCVVEPCPNCDFSDTEYVTTSDDELVQRWHCNWCNCDFEVEL